MAWIDDRIWCLPKFTPLSAPAFAAYIKGIAYSSGMGTKGRLEPSVQKLIGGSRKIRAELVDGNLWDLNGDGETVLIHDWDEHNAKRDLKRENDRERKRRQRGKEKDE